MLPPLIQFTYLFFHKAIFEGIAWKKMEKKVKILRKISSVSRKKSSINDCPNEHVVVNNVDQMLTDDYLCILNSPFDLKEVQCCVKKLKNGSLTFFRSCLKMHPLISTLYLLIFSMIY